MVQTLESEVTRRMQRAEFLAQARAAAEGIDAGAALRSYRPKARSLYLLACGPKYAIASWGRCSAEGPWVWSWKDWIDRRFIRRFGVLSAGRKL